MTPQEINRALGALQMELNRKWEPLRSLGFNVYRLASFLEDLAEAFNRLEDYDARQREADAYDGEQADGTWR